MNAIIAAWGAAVLGWEGVRYGWDTEPMPRRPQTCARVSPWIMVALGGWIAVQTLLPLRHFLIPGNVHWTEEGHRWSWHMKLRDKDLHELIITLHVPGEEPRHIRRTEHRLARHQWKKMGHVPEMLVQYAQHLKQASGHPDAQVTAEAWVSLNGRPPQLLLDPNRDLSAIKRPWWPPGDFILPLHEALPRQVD